MKKLILLLILLPSTSALAIPFWPWYSDGYTEKLARHRKRFPAKRSSTKPSCPKQNTICNSIDTVSHIPQTDITQRLNDTLAHVKKVLQHNKIRGYTIQIHAGNSREQAFALKKRLYTYGISAEATVKYNQPNYIVQVGKFFSKLEAYESYAMLARKFLRVIIRPADFPNKPNMFCKQVAANTKNRSNTPSQTASN